MKRNFQKTNETFLHGLLGFKKMEAVSKLFPRLFTFRTHSQNSLATLKPPV